MKRAILLLAVMFTVGIYAQDTEPKVEQVGKMEKVTYFHDNGTIAQTGHMLKGKLHGQWFMYNVEGKKIASGKYEDGIRQGKWMFWKGQELSEVDFVDNRIVAVKKWNNAEIVSTYK
ncbi:MAG: nicotinic acid mononucleotide adenyltransferase [Allomuricauda sp.]|nr:MAG: nicotinic acid mononucleotide adenyltransferase [Allomuricauda sp.]